MSDTYTNSASFKLATFETIAADPMLKPIDLSLFIAYAKFMKWPQRTSYLSNIKARILTGNASQPTISKSRSRLVKAGYLVQVMVKMNGCTLFELNNSRAEIVSDHVTIAEESLKEWDAARKAKDREKLQGVKEISTPDKQEGKRNYADRVKETYDNSLEYSFEGEAQKENIKTERTYAEQSRGW